MDNKYFVHQIKGNAERTESKGIVEKETYEGALQAYHSYLGAYAYGMKADTDFVQCMITDLGGSVLMNEAWVRQPEPKPEPEPEPTPEPEPEPEPTPDPEPEPEE